MNEVAIARSKAIEAVKNYARACLKCNEIPSLISGKGSVLEDLIFRAFAYEICLGSRSLREAGRLMKADYNNFSRRFKIMGLEL